MIYAQTNYSQTQGINGQYTIAQIGCFLTSFCNLLSRFGQTVSPPELNNYFSSRGLYIDVDDGIRDDLAWSSIGQFNGDVVITKTGTGTPPHANSIVKFEYKSARSGNFTTHFCLVDRIENGVVYVIDSWDGAVKAASLYGGVKAYAAYEIKSASQPQQGGSAVNDKFTNEQEVKPFYVALRGDEATLEERKGWIGRPKIEFITSANTATEARNNAAERKRVPGLEQRIRDLEKQLSERPATNSTAATPKQIAAEKVVDALKDALNK